jgi:hypothetical protein
VRKLTATVFNYSLDGLLADEGTSSGGSASACPETVSPTTRRKLEFLRSAYAHVMGRTAYEGIASAMTTVTHHPLVSSSASRSGILELQYRRHR